MAGIAILQHLHNDTETVRVLERCLPLCHRRQRPRKAYHVAAAMRHGSGSLLLQSFVRCIARGRAMVAIAGRILKGAVIVHVNVLTIALLDVVALFVHGSHASVGNQAMLL